MRRVWSVAALCLVAAAACGADTASAPGVPSTAPAATAVVAETLPLVGGGTFDSARLDQGPLALWFWAPG